LCRYAASLRPGYPSYLGTVEVLNLDPLRRDRGASGLDAEVRERRRELRRFCLIGKPQLLAPGARPPRELPEVRFLKACLSVGGIRAALKLR
jgi:hypothetical protein